MITKKNLKKLKDKLPSGWATTIKETLEGKDVEVSEPYIRMVLNGERNNEDIISEAIHLAGLAKEKSEETNKAISEL